MALVPRSDLLTHAVENQPGEPTVSNLFAMDAVLKDHAIGADHAALTAFGATLASDDVRQAGRDAERHKPELKIFDRTGRRIDEVHFHPAYHKLMKVGLEAGYASGPWTGGSHVTHAVQCYLMSQVEPGVCCPMTMTYASVPALSADKKIEQIWRPALTSGRYDPAIAPISSKAGATLGMAMTEKQGGSDVRANTTRAELDGDDYRLMGHKWFCSAPMSDGFLTLAQAPDGLTCFLVPRWLDGERNAIEIMRLKEKLGNRANASSEIEYHGAVAYRLGDEGQGVQNIIRMVHHTRLDTAIAPAGLMRAALVEAHHWISHRTAFQRRLIDQPLMQTVLADLALDWEGATALGLRVARAFDRAEDGPFARIAASLAKYLSNKRCPVVVAEAMEIMGGMGYVEDTPLPMLYREAPLNGIWEGSGNVICLDVLRTFAKVPEAREALVAELNKASGCHPLYDAALGEQTDRWKSATTEAGARMFTESMATLLTASVLLHQAPNEVADAYVTTRLGGRRGLTPGAVDIKASRAILDRIGAQLM